MNTYSNYIAGADVPAADGRTFTAFNPTTGGVWGTFALAGRVGRRSRRQGGVRRVPHRTVGQAVADRRGRLLMKWGEMIAEHAERIATIETEQNGKLFAEMRAQAAIVQDLLYYFGGLADKIEGTVIPLDRQSVFNYTLREPLGVVGVITPWNSPTFLTIMSLAPALAAGNTIVLKPSEVTSASAVELAQPAPRRRHPAGVINVVTRLPRDRRGAGRSPAGRARSPLPAASAPAARSRARAGQRLVSCTLELGGKSPNIVFGDAEPRSGGGGRAGRHLRRGGADLRRGLARLHPRVDLRQVRRTPRERAPADQARRSADGRRPRWVRSRPRRSSRRTRRWCSARVSEGAEGAVRRRAAGVARVPGRALLPADDRAQRPRTTS